jgi:hypothetical protein
MAIFYTDSGSFNDLKVTGSIFISASRGIALQVKSSGSTIFSVSGSAGEIFNISDAGSSTSLFIISSGSTNILNVDSTKAVSVSGSLVVTGSAYISNNVVIGTTADSGHKLYISGSGASGSLNVNNILYVGNSNIGINTTASSTWTLDIRDSTGKFRVGNNNFTDVFTVGVGSGNQGYSDMYLNGQTFAAALYANPQNLSYTVNGITYSTASVGLIAGGGSSELVLGSANTEKIRIHLTGDVSIGTQADNKTLPGYKLNVTGSGVSGSFKVNNILITSGSHTILPQVSSSLNFANDTAAAAGGVPLGGLYRNGNAIQIRLV